jgi:predicted Zn-dependent protease
MSRFRSLLTAAPLALAFALPAAAGAQRSAAPSSAAAMNTLAETRQIATNYIAASVRRYGRDTVTARRRDIENIITALNRTVGYDTHPLQWEIVMDSSMNAAAIPGGGMLIHVGLPLFCESYAAKKTPADATAQRRNYLACIAAVVGHEFGHLELGHTENFRETSARRQETNRRMRQAGNLTAIAADSVIMGSQRFERDQELAADRAGALYILRAGYEIQDAIDTFDALERDERSDPNFRGRITWIYGHPRWSERMAMLEIARGQLKLLQRDYDDAIALIEANQLPDSALAMVNRVLEAFPTFAPAQHAKAVILAQQWLNGSDAAELRFRPALPAYDSRFIGQIRGSSPTQGVAARRPAREAFAAVFTQDAHPYTLANLAVLEAYDGETASAIQKANLAAQRAPRDPYVLNNQGVVLALANRNAEARAAFVAAERAAGDRIPLMIVFNQARVALAMGDRAGAQRQAQRYLSADRRSNWAREAEQILASAGGAPAPATPAATPAPATAPTSVPAPTVAGVDFGAPRSRVASTLGEPDGGREAAGAVWRYPARGLTIAFDDEGTVKMFVIENRSVGAVGGVTVGDDWAAVQRVAGAPELEQRVAQGTMYKWNRGAWVLAVIVQNGNVLAIGAARN